MGDCGCHGQDGCDCGMDCGCCPGTDKIIAVAPESSTDKLVKDVVDAAGESVIPAAHGDPITKHNTIKSNFQKACKAKFLDRFGYAYNGNESTPLTIVPDEAPWGTEGFVTAGGLLNQKVNSYIQQNIVKSSPFLGLAEDAIVGDIGGFVSSLLGSAQGSPIVKEHEWSSSAQSQDPGKAFRIQTVICCGNIDVPDKAGNTTRFFLLYYCGVGYWAGC
ncbi:hypothetical protein GP486_001536 [Trichoglossum hirsutum]|uniref:Uncharacterized protein n=1 Tax=Trichoglossum hirsutum TaxID=265104 RepID=A0A9P8RT07_9PEZI|nr:hypothetical protein GP486_001536 [Trichoglossum hirsutum]